LLPFFAVISASASSTILRTSYVLNTNLPLSATRLPFFRILRVVRSASASLSCFRRVTFSLCVASKARLIRSVQRFTGDGLSLEALIACSSSAFASRISILSGGGLSSNNRSMLVRCGGVCGGVCGGEAVVADLVGSFSSTVIGLRGTRPALCHPLNTLRLMRALSRARMYVSTHCARGMRLVSSRRIASASQAKARLSGANTPTSSG
jgi:hypothetical protein